MGHPYPDDPEKAARYDRANQAENALVVALQDAGVEHSKAAAVAEAFRHLAWCEADRLKDGMTL